MESLQFDCLLENVSKAEVVINLFQGVGEQEAATTGDNTEFLLHLEAEVAAKPGEKVQEAEFIVVVDRSGSMQGTPWTQVQGALAQMLQMVQGQGNIRTRVIAYNQQAILHPLTGDTSVDRAAIDKMRATGSTSFVAVFNELSAIFKNKKEDSSKAYFVFFMTDGEDTVSSPKEIMKQKEKMQTDIEEFGAEVVFHVMGFSENHDEQFLESLTFLGTSDGTYSFVSPSEGDRAVKERLVQLIQSTSSVVGRNLSIEMESEDLLFLGDTFGEGKKEVVVPAMVARQGDTITIATKKFVKKLPHCTGVPKLKLTAYEKLTGQPKAIEATVANMKEIIIRNKTDITDHNLKKLRTALNMITSAISEADQAEEVDRMKVWHKLVQEKFSNMTINEAEATEPMRNRMKAVQAGINICNEVYEEGNDKYSERERMMKGQAAYHCYNLTSHQQQNTRAVKSKAASSNMWLAKKASRSTLQSKSKQADYAASDFVMVDKQKK